MACGGSGRYVENGGKYVEDQQRMWSISKVCGGRECMRRIGKVCEQSEYHVDQELGGGGVQV